MKAAEECFLVAPFIVLSEVVLTFEFVLSNDGLCISQFCKMKIEGLTPSSNFGHLWQLSKKVEYLTSQNKRGKADTTMGPVKDVPAAGR